MFFVQRTKYTNSGSLTTMRASSARTFFEWPQKLLYIMSVNMLDSFRIFATGSISAPFLPPQSHTMPMPYNQPLYLTCRVFTDIYLERANVTMNSNAPAKFWHPIAMPAAVTSTLIHIYHTGELTNNVATWIFHLRMLFFLSLQNTIPTWRHYLGMTETNIESICFQGISGNWSVKAKNYRNYGEKEKSYQK